MQYIQNIDNTYKMDEMLFHLRNTALQNQRIILLKQLLNAISDTLSKIMYSIR